MKLEERLDLLSDFGDVQIVKLSNGKHKVSLLPFDTRLEACGEISAIGFGVDKMVHVCWVMLANVLTTLAIRGHQLKARGATPCQDL